MASTSGFEAPGWSFSDIPKPSPTTSSPESEFEHILTPGSEPVSSFDGPSREPDARPNPPNPGPQQQRERTYPPRTCRICFDVVQPTVDLPNENLPGFMQGRPRVRYESSPEDGGRLLRPCLCKGTSKYVHEGCLNSWRLANPSNARNYYDCPTCKFKYQIERLRWATYIQSTLAELALTFLILLASVFLLGFIADPIITLYLEPSRGLTWLWRSEPIIPVHAPRRGSKRVPVPEPDTWIEHFLKGFASLGLLSFVKLFFTAPLNWIRVGNWNIGGFRVNTAGRNRAGVQGRDRLAELSWVVIVIGVMTFIYGVFKGVRAWSRRTLNGLGARVLDVQGDDDDIDEEEPASAPNPSSDQHPTDRPQPMATET